MNTIGSNHSVYEIFSQRTRSVFNNIKEKIQNIFNSLRNFLFKTGAGAPIDPVRVERVEFNRHIFLNTDFKENSELLNQIKTTNFYIEYDAIFLDKQNQIVYKINNTEIRLPKDCFPVEVFLNCLKQENTSLYDQVLEHLQIIDTSGQNEYEVILRKKEVETEQTPLIREEPVNNYSTAFKVAAVVTAFAASLYFSANSN